MENDIWILDVNIIHHVGCFAILASTLRSDEAVISRANKRWVQHGFIHLSGASKLLCSSIQPRAGPVSGSGQELAIAGPWLGDGPDAQLVSDGPSPLMATWQIWRLRDFTSNTVFSCMVWRGVAANPHQEILGSKAKQGEERSCQARVQSQVRRARTTWLLLMHTRGFQVHVTKSTSAFRRKKELERTSINPISVCLHWTLSEPVVRNVLSYFSTVWQLEGLRIVAHNTLHFQQVFLTSHSDKLNWGKPFPSTGDESLQDLSKLWWPKKLQQICLILLFWPKKKSLLKLNCFYKCFYSYFPH